MIVGCPVITARVSCNIFFIALHVLCSLCIYVWHTVVLVNLMVACSCAARKLLLIRKLSICSICWHICFYLERSDIVLVVQ